MKSKTVFLSLLFLLFFASTVFASLTDGLVAYYPFNGNANDASGNGNHGAIWGDVSYIDGLIGQCAKFGGVDSPGHIKVANNSSLQFNQETTFSLWVKVNQMGTMDGYGNLN